MAGSVEQHLAPAVAGALENLGWNGEDLAARDGVPPVSRGGNVVAILPPAPSWATPLVAAVLSRNVVDGGRVLILAAPATLAEWTLAIGALTEAGALQVDTAWDGEGASVRTAARPSDILIASPESALARHARSALHPDTFRAVVFAWPEQWVADEAVTALLQDIPKDAQRVALTARRDLLEGPDSIVERYARKAMIVAPAVAGTAPPDAPHIMSVRTVATSWAGRAAAVAGLVAANETPSLTIWTADRRDHQVIRRTLGSLRSGLALQIRDLPPSGAVICYDLPAPHQLAMLSGIGEVTLLVPPGTEDYVTRLAPTRRPLNLRSAAQAVVDRDAALRFRISDTITQGNTAAALYALAPLFEQFDAQLVASAILDLWRAQAAGDPTGRTSGAAVAPGGQSGPQSAARGAEPRLQPRTIAPVAKLWIGAGKKDDATVADFVAVLVREVGLERSKIGRIELRDTFALVEVPAAEADAIATRLGGITIRKRKLTARVDGGRGAPKRRP